MTGDGGDRATLGVGALQHLDVGLARYSLTRPENEAAVAAGLAGGDWFRSAVPRKRMKELMRRSDAPAIRDTVIWVGLMVGFAGTGIAFWGSWWAVPFFLAYGVLYGSSSDSRWHEAGHGPAFATRWLDEAVYQVACFMIMRDPNDYASGKALGAPVLVDVRTYPTRVEDGTVYIGVD